MVGLGGRQHAGRLVEDQDFGAAVERLEDFHALLEPDRQFLDDGVGIDLQAVFALQPLQFRTGVGDAPLQERLILGAEDDVLYDGEIFDQHEMLVDHADAERDGVVRRLDRDGFAADFDLAAVGLVKAVEDRHQRRLARAVLSDDAADGAALDGQIDVAIGPDSTETLVDSDEFDSSFSHAAAHLIVFYHPVKTLACRHSAANRALPGASRQIPRSLSISTADRRWGTGDSQDDAWATPRTA